MLRQLHCQLISLPSLIAFNQGVQLLSEIAAEYLALKQIDQTPPRVALTTFISLAGDRDVSEYSREDAKLFVHHFNSKVTRQLPSGVGSTASQLL